MMRRCAVIVALVALALLNVKANGQQVSDAQIAEGIKAGESKNFKSLVSECLATAGFGEKFSAQSKGGFSPTGSFDVTVSSSVGRIAYLAAQAKRLYKTFALADVPEALKTPSVFVSVEPNAPMGNPGGKGSRMAALIETVVLKGKADAVVQPASVELEPVSWPSTEGGKVEANRAVARFDFGAFGKLPPGEFDVITITVSGERKCKVGAKDRDRLFPTGI